MGTALTRSRWKVRSWRNAIRLPGTPRLVSSLKTGQQTSCVASMRARRRVLQVSRQQGAQVQIQMQCDRQKLAHQTVPHARERTYNHTPGRQGCWQGTDKPHSHEAVLCLFSRASLICCCCCRATRRAPSLALSSAACIQASSVRQTECASAYKTATGKQWIYHTISTRVWQRRCVCVCVCVCACVRVWQRRGCTASKGLA